jgi:hypothetical protein
MKAYRTINFNQYEVQTFRRLHHERNHAESASVLLEIHSIPARFITRHVLINSYPLCIGNYNLDMTKVMLSEIS